MAEHKHGTMDVKDHEKTFAGYVTFTSNAVIVIIAILIFMALVNA